MPDIARSSALEAPKQLPRVLVTSDEINLLVYAYLCESRFEHAAYNLRHEARLDRSPLLSNLPTVIPDGAASVSKGKQPAEGRSANGNARRRDSAALLDGQGDGYVREGQSDLAGLVPRGKLVKMLQSGLMFNEVKRHTGPGGVIHECTAPYRLLTPHLCENDALESPQLAFSALEDYNPVDSRSDLPAVPETPRPPIGPKGASANGQRVRNRRQRREHTRRVRFRMAG